MIYLTREVFDFWHNWERSPSERTERSGTVLDNTTGLSVVRPRADQPRKTLDLNYRILGRAEITRFRDLLDTIRGRRTSFWCPTWESDLQPTADVSGTALTVESVGYAGRMFPASARRHLALIRHNRTIYARGVTAAVDNGTTETLTLDAAPAETVLRGTSLVSFLLLVRLDSDDVLLTYETPTIMTTTLRLVEVPTEVPTP